MPLAEFIDKIIEAFDAYMDGIEDAEYVADAEYDRACAFAKRFNSLVCQVREHCYIPDHCGRPEHDYCERCGIRRP